MGFNSTTLLSLPLGLLLPVAIIVFLIISKKKKNVSFDSFFIGFGSFLASIAIVAALFIAFNAVFLSTITFSDDTSGIKTVGAIIVCLIIALYIVCESFKLSAIKKAQTADVPKEYTSLGFSAGVIASQNIIVFVALNIFSHYEMNIGYAIFSGGILLFTGIMYLVLSYASEIMLRDNHKGPAYAISSVYYVFWITVILLIAAQINSSLIVYVISAFYFVVSFVLSAVFIFKIKKIKPEADKK